MHELIKGLVWWAVTLTGYEQPAELPVVEAVSRQQLIKILCDDQFCTAVAYYDPKAQIIFYDKGMRLEQNQSARGVIVHEMVHYLQDMNGELVVGEMSCEQRIEKEREAYRVQQNFLREHHESTFQIDLAVALLGKVCKNNNVSQ